MVLKSCIRTTNEVCGKLYHKASGVKWVMAVKGISHWISLVFDLFHDAFHFDDSEE